VCAWACAGWRAIDITDHCDYVTDGDPSLANAKAAKFFADDIVDTASKPAIT